MATRPYWWRNRTIFRSALARWLQHNRRIDQSGLGKLSHLTTTTLIFPSPPPCPPPPPPPPPGRINGGHWGVFTKTTPQGETRMGDCERKERFTHYSVVAIVFSACGKWEEKRIRVKLQNWNCTHPRRSRGVTQSIKCRIPSLSSSEYVPTDFRWWIVLKSSPPDIWMLSSSRSSAYSFSSPYSSLTLAP